MLESRDLNKRLRRRAEIRGITVHAGFKNRRGGFGHDGADRNYPCHIYGGWGENSQMAPAPLRYFRKGDGQGSLTGITANPWAKVYGERSRINQVPRNKFEDENEHDVEDDSTKKS